MQDHFAGSIRNGWKMAFSTIIAVLLLCSASRAQEVCPVEIKLLLSPPTIKSVIASVGFEKEATGRVYFFDTENLALLMQGVIVRVRQGAKNDLTIKVRLPDGDKRIDSSKLREHFGCEIDRTGAAANISFSVGQKYKHRRVPETGSDISTALSSHQRRLLQEAHVLIDWSQVRRIANINSTTWEAAALPQFPKLSLEFWEWPDGSILELSAKTTANEWGSKSEELHRIANTKGLLLSARQETKTSTVLRTLTHNTSRPE